ncbi:hypothetical protein F53441_14038 [Fusarium austroafricanum]|uniref:Rhodopsin domain-containing protein n=1 Tax=Fusarium austroafricanum TaxID=2364996 RepID=A0A8H4NFD0_9HYPO|nr:hypothetical protein F53441_14038 [Fusarium austroafricanum]
MIRPAADGVPLLYVTIVMLTLAWIFSVARLAVRRWKNNLGLDDWLMFAGLMLYTVTASLVITCCFHGAGQKSKALDTKDIMMGTKLFFVAQFFYASCTVPIKASICVTMLRICGARRRFVWTLWGLIAITVITSIIFILATANICHPIETLWGGAKGVCNTKLNSSIGFFFSAISIVVDWSLAILPALLLWKVQMKNKVKIPVIFMLSLGAFASSATVVRLGYLTLYNDPAEFMYSTGAIGLWSIVEEGIGIMAGSMPALRPLLSLPIFRGTSYPSNSASNGISSGKYAPHMSGGKHARINSRNQEAGLEMHDFQSHLTTKIGHGNEDKVRHSNDGDSQKYILKQTQVTMTTERTPSL